MSDRMLPAPALRPYVACYWLQIDHRAHADDESVLPSGATELLFDLTGTTATPFLLGPRTSPFRLHRRTHEIRLGVHFRTGGAGVLLGVAEAALAHAALDAPRTLGLDTIDDCARELRGLRTLPPAALRLDRWLLARLRSARAPRGFVGHALDALARTSPPSIDRIANDVALSSRRFGSLFADATGYAPKTFARLQRFHRALRLLHGAPASATVDVALACGYYDQSHMHRDFAEFGALTPRAYVARRTLDPFHVWAT